MGVGRRCKDLVCQVGEQTLSWESVGQPLSITPCAMSMASCLAAKWRHVKPSYNGVWDEFTFWLIRPISHIRSPKYSINYCIICWTSGTECSSLSPDRHSTCQHSNVTFALFTPYYQLNLLVAVARCSKAKIIHWYWNEKLLCWKCHIVFLALVLWI